MSSRDLPTAPLRQLHTHGEQTAPQQHAEAGLAFGPGREEDQTHPLRPHRRVTAAAAQDLSRMGQIARHPPGPKGKASLCPNSCCLLRFLLEEPYRITLSYRIALNNGETLRIQQRPQKTGLHPRIMKNHENVPHKSPRLLRYSSVR